MPIDVKVVVDCRDPHRLTAFWAEALGYLVEDNSALVQQLLDGGAVPPAATVQAGGRLAWRDLAAVRHPDDPVQPFTGTGLGRRLLFQVVPEPKTTKNRLHLDLHVGSAAQPAEVARLAALGARVLAEVDDRGSRHVTMADPEGNEFDVQ